PPACLSSMKSLSRQWSMKPRTNRVESLQGRQHTLATASFYRGSSSSSSSWQASSSCSCRTRRRPSTRTATTPWRMNRWRSSAG
ncbi:unnamed protein product, partial [Candidula unifasciata]